MLKRKVEIDAYKKPNLLNKRNEIVSKRFCRHQLKYTVAMYDTKGLK